MTGRLSHPKALRRFMARQRCHRAKLRHLNGCNQDIVLGLPEPVRIKDENAI